MRFAGRLRIKSDLIEKFFTPFFLALSLSRCLIENRARENAGFPAENEGRRYG